MSDLVARLRACAPRPHRCGAMSGAGYRCKLDVGHHEFTNHEWSDITEPGPTGGLCIEAADEIERLRDRLAFAESLLRPGASSTPYVPCAVLLTYGNHCVRAAGHLGAHRFQ